METRHDLDRKERKKRPVMPKAGVYEVVEREDGSFDYILVEDKKDLDDEKDDVQNSDTDKRE